MASASSLAHFNSANSGEKGMETIEIDPQFAEGLGLALGDVVRSMLHLSTLPISPDLILMQLLQGRNWTPIRPDCCKVCRYRTSNVR